MKLFFLLPLLLCFSASAQFKLCKSDSGRFSGECVTYYSSGAIRKVANYKNDKLHGEYKEYTERGELIAEGHLMKDGLLGETYDNTVITE